MNNNPTTVSHKALSREMVSRIVSILSYLSKSFEEKYKMIGNDILCDNNLIMPVLHWNPRDFLRRHNAYRNFNEFNSVAKISLSPNKLDSFSGSCAVIYNPSNVLIAKFMHTVSAGEAENLLVRFSNGHKICQRFLVKPQDDGDSPKLLCLGRSSLGAVAKNVELQA